MSLINNILWMIATFMLISCGLYFTFKLKFTQFDFKTMFKGLKKEKNDKVSISPFKTLTLALAARIGVGSLAGIALGIYKGGIGVIFWIWLSCLITLPNSFVESTLAVMHREKDGKYYQGGPSFYIKKGLGLSRLAIIYSIIICLCYLGGFLAIQSNTIASSMNEFLNISKVTTGIVVAVISYIIISHGLGRIANFTSFLVPIMGIIYMITSLVIIIININNIPDILLSIVKEAFNIKALGWGIISSIIIGTQRGIFSSEAGIGTGAVASGTSDTKYPTKQGYIQMLGVYFTTFIVCTGTAFIILTSNIDINSFADPNGIEITLNALNNHLGSFGTIILLISLIAFAFSTIISGYYYGESNLKFLFKMIDKKKMIYLNIFVVFILIYGAVARPSILWNLVDIGVALLAIINTIAMFLLRHEVYNEFKKEKV